MKLGTAFVAFALVIVLSSTSASAQSANDALVALKMLETRCETGISYRDYSAALAEAKFPVRLFIESGQAEGQPQVIDALNRAIEHYEFAGRLWNARFTAGNSDRYLSGGFIRPKTALGILLKEKYPEVPIMEKLYPIDLALPHIWAHASSQLRTASEILASAEPSDADKIRAENEKMRADLELEELRLENEELKKRLEIQKQ